MEQCRELSGPKPSPRATGVTSHVTPWHVSLRQITLELKYSVWLVHSVHVISGTTSSDVTNRRFILHYVHYWLLSLFKAFILHPFILQLPSIRNRVILPYANCLDGFWSALQRRTIVIRMFSILCPARANKKTPWSCKSQTIGLCDMILTSKYKEVNDTKDQRARVAHREDH